MSDNNGNLLLYTDGSEVRDAAGTQRAEELHGDPSSTQSAIIVPNPGNSNQYYIFTTAGASCASEHHLDGVRIDISTWEVRPISELMSMPNEAGLSPTEKLTVILGPDGDYFVITIVQDQLPPSNASFRIIHVTSSGLEYSSPDRNINAAISDLGYLKASPTGTRIAAANYNTKNVFVWNFDGGAVDTGSRREIPVPQLPGNHAQTPYGVEFSPDGEILYYSVVGNHDGYEALNKGYIFQVDLTQATLASTLIVDYKRPVEADSNRYALCALQLGIDGRIYIAKDGERSLGVISDPNHVWSSSDPYPDPFLNSRIELDPHTKCYMGLPNLIPQPGRWCCPGRNLLDNGGFEMGYSGFSSDYSLGNASFPGNFDLVTGNQALAISPNWVVSDHYTSSPGLGRVMVVNGRACQTGKKAIWRCTVAVSPGNEYRFCCNAKHLPQSTFDVKPVIEVKCSEPNNITPQPVILTTGAGPNDWMLIAGTVRPGGTSLTIEVLLDEQGLGDGNDLALDDISLQRKADMDPKMVSFELHASNISVADGHYHLRAVPLDWNPVPPGYGYWWEVCRLNSSGAVLDPVQNKPWWWTLPPHCEFAWYNGMNDAPDLSPNAPTPGVFLFNQRYRVTFGAWGNCVAWKQTSYVVEYDAKSKGVKIKRVESSPADFRSSHMEMKYPNCRCGLK